MNHCIIKAATVKMPDGKEFWLFEDTTGEVTDESSAMDFIIDAKSHFTGPLVLIFQEKRGDVRVYGDAPFAAFASTLRRDEIVFQNVFVSLSKKKPNLN